MVKCSSSMCVLYHWQTQWMCKQVHIHMPYLRHLQSMLVSQYMQRVQSTIGSHIGACLKTAMRAFHSGQGRLHLRSIQIQVLPPLSAPSSPHHGFASEETE